MRRMKGSGVEWIGEMPEEWGLNRIKYVCETNPPCKQYPNLDEYVSYAPMECVKNGHMESRSIQLKTINSGLTYFADGDIVMAKVTPCFENGNIAVAHSLSNGIGFGSSELFVFRPQNILARWIYYYLQNPVFVDRCKSTMTGTGGLKRVSLAFIRNYLFAIPGIEEQRTISSYLDSKTAKINALISNNEAQIERLKQYKQSLITETATRGLNPDAPMKDSGVEWIGKIPEDWTVFPSKYLFSDYNERRRDGDEQLTASQKYGMISQSEYMDRENARIVMADKGLENWKHIEPNDFVISLRSFQGGLEMSNISGCVTWHYIVLRASRNLCCSYYKWLFKSSAYITALQMTCNYIRDGQDLRYSNFVEVPLCEPPIPEQKAIAAYLDSKTLQIDTVISLKQRKIEKLKQYRQSLIYECVTGKRDLR